MSFVGALLPLARIMRVDPLMGRDQLDLDSMDFVNFLVAVDEALGVETPEKDYPKLATIDQCGSYLRAKLAGGGLGGGRGIPRTSLVGPFVAIRRIVDDHEHVHSGSDTYPTDRRAFIEG